MEFRPPLARGALIERYKRFLADVRTPAGDVLTMHCPNTGAMLGCSTPGSPVWYSTAANPKRKYAHTLEIVETVEGDTVGVNPVLANALVAEALAAGRLPMFDADATIRREARIPEAAGASGRFDFALSEGSARETLVEVKSVTLARAGIAAFPDAASARARRHVDALVDCAAAGHRAVLLFCVQHSGAVSVTTAADIDPEYAAAVTRASGRGVEVVAVACRVSPQEICVTHTLPVQID